MKRFLPLCVVFFSSVTAQALELEFRHFDKALWKQTWSNNPQEHLNKEIRRRTDAVGVFPHRDAIIRLVGAILCDQNEERAVVRRYMTFTKDNTTEDDKQTKLIKSAA